MPTLQVYNVKGDGNCYYRCLWRIAKANPKVARALLVNDVNNEEEGMKEIREFVALSLEFENINAKTTIENLIKLFANVTDLDTMYPFLARIHDKNADIKKIMKEIARIVENTNMYASSLEHQIIVERFAAFDEDPILDCKLVVLTQSSHETIEDLSEKWMNDLYKIVCNCANKFICVIINEDNIHYKYTKLFGKFIIKCIDLKQHIEERMNESSDSDISNVED
jgi:hypothetical protein